MQSLIVQENLSFLKKGCIPCSLVHSSSVILLGMHELLRANYDVSL